MLGSSVSNAVKAVGLASMGPAELAGRAIQLVFCELPWMSEHRFRGLAHRDH